MQSFVLLNHEPWQIISQDKYSKILLNVNSCITYNAFLMNEKSNCCIMVNTNWTQHIFILTWVIDSNSMTHVRITKVLFVTLSLWWTLTDLNRWPFARQANALPAELNVHNSTELLYLKQTVKSSTFLY